MGSKDSPMTSQMALPMQYDNGLEMLETGNNGFQTPPGNQMLDQQQQYQEPHLQDSQSFLHSQQPSLQYFHGPTSRNDGQSLEPQIQRMREPNHVERESQHSDQYLYAQQQQQHPCTCSVPQMKTMSQDQLIQLQEQHQQQQLLGIFPKHQMSPMHQQSSTRNLSLQAPGKTPYKPWTCARRLMQFMHYQQKRPHDNNIEFWRKYVAEFFAPHAKKKWCVSMYGSDRQISGVFPQDVWHCKICNSKPGRGFEATAVGLPRIYQMKYESGTLKELLYVDLPNEYQDDSGLTVLYYAKAIQESVFEQLRVVHYGQLRIEFSADLKICSWEFCAQRHEEIIPRRVLLPQISHLGSASQQYQTTFQRTDSNLSTTELQYNCNVLVNSAQNLANALEVPLVNDLGYTKSYVRCLQTTEVVNIMRDLIDFSQETGKGPIESLVKFPRRMNSPPQWNGSHAKDGQLQHQVQPDATTSGNIAIDQTHQHASSIGVYSAKNSLSPTHLNAGPGLVHQIPVNSSQQNSSSNAHNSYGESSHAAVIPSNTQIHSKLALCYTNGGMPESSSMPLDLPAASSPNDPQPVCSNVTLTAPAAMGSENLPANLSMQQPTVPNESQSSVEKIIEEMISWQHSNRRNESGGFGGSFTGSNGVFSNGGSSAHGSGISNNGGFRSTVGNDLTQSSSMFTGLGNTLSNSLSVNGEMANQPQNIGTEIQSNLCSVDNIINSQSDRKDSS